MNNSLEQHPITEVSKQLQLRMKKTGLDTVKVLVSRRAGKYQCSFTGSTEQVAQAEKILADWA
jgi:hypothetical protein